MSSGTRWRRSGRTLPVVAPDLRGAGRSPVPDRPWKVDDMCATIELRKALGCVRRSGRLRHRFGDFAPPLCRRGRQVVRAWCCRIRPIAWVESRAATKGGSSRWPRRASRRCCRRSSIWPSMAAEGRALWRYMDGSAGTIRGLWRARARHGRHRQHRDPQDRSPPRAGHRGAHDTLLPPPLSRGVHEMLTGSELLAMVNAVFRALSGAGGICRPGGRFPRSAGPAGEVLTCAELATSRERCNKGPAISTACRPDRF